MGEYEHDYISHLIFLPFFFFFLTVFPSELFSLHSPFCTTLSVWKSGNLACEKVNLETRELRLQGSAFDLSYEFRMNLC